MSRKPPLRGYILRAAKIIFPIGKAPYVRFLHAEPEKNKNRVILYAFHDPRLVWPGWTFHTNKEALVANSSRSRLTVFVDSNYWRASGMQDLVALEIDQRDNQAVWATPVHADLELLRRYYIGSLAALHAGEAPLRVRRNFLAALREQRR